MGTEIISVLFYPVALVCVLAGIGFWYLGVSEIVTPGKERVRAFLPLAAAFILSMAAMTATTYREVDADYTQRVVNGVLTEAERQEYFPSAVEGRTVAALFFVLPLMAFVVIPMTARLIATHRLSMATIGRRALAGWLALSLLSWCLEPGRGFAWSFGGR